jgi:hypothetical protein
MALSWRVKQQGNEADHSSPSSAEIKNGEAIPPLPRMSSRRGDLLIKSRDNCALLILIWKYIYDLHLFKAYF